MSSSHLHLPGLSSPRPGARPAHASHLSRVALVAVIALAAVGCTHVRPFERGTLARPTMSAGSLTGAGEEHVYEVHEGAAGGGTGSGGGCGCN